MKHETGLEKNYKISNEINLYTRTDLTLIKVQDLGIMNTAQVWILVIIGLGLFIYFVPYKNIKIVHKKLDTIIELLNKKDNK